jgi:retinol-binding protein 3
MADRPVTFPPLNVGLAARIVEKTAETVRDKYIFEGDAKAMSDLLLSRLQKGAFRDLKTVPDLTSGLTEALHSVKVDLHLVAMPWLPCEEGQDSGGVMDSWHQRMPRHNYEFRKLEVLLGNIGYVDLRGFASAADGGATAASAMQFLSHTDALIFDLRDNGGGEDLVYFLMSYLFDKPTHVHTARHRDHDEQNWTYGYVPGTRFPDKPAYVVISRSTFSAGEDFSYNLQQLGRVTVVGEQTRGGAHPVEFYRFPELYLELMIPNAYSENPVSRANWEETGVTPDIVADADGALDVAHEKALERLIVEADDEEVRRYREWALESVRARRAPYHADGLDLSLYAGAYGKSVQIDFQDGSLRLTWGARRAYHLTPLSEHRFEFDHGTQRAEFVVEDGRATELVWLTEDGGETRLSARFAAS